MQNKIIVAGIGPGDKSYTTPAALQKIRSAKFLVAGRRALRDFSGSNQITFPITADTDSAINFIRKNLSEDEVVVAVSGDPGYYSILDLLRKNFDPSTIEVIPSVSSMQLAFARLSLPHHSATLLSFHGRRPSDEDLKFAPGKILGLLTDAKYNSTSISEILIGLNWSKKSKIAICEKLSYPDEKIFITTLENAAKQDPVKNCILIAGENF